MAMNQEQTQQEPKPEQTTQHESKPEQTQQFYHEENLNLLANEDTVINGIRNGDIKVWNLTQHEPTKDQLDVGVRNTGCREEVKKLLTFEDIPTKEEMYSRARKLAGIVFSENVTRDFYGKKPKVMIGGAPYFMPILEQVLRDEFGYEVVYAFSKRVVEEHQLPDGSVEKRFIFKHLGFVSA